MREGIKGKQKTPKRKQRKDKRKQNRTQMKCKHKKCQLILHAKWLIKEKDKDIRVKVTERKSARMLKQKEKTDKNKTTG